MEKWRIRRMLPNTYTRTIYQVGHLLVFGYWKDLELFFFGDVLKRRRTLAFRAIIS
jgi:hypothetical protein